MRATAQSLLERSCPITGRRPISHRSERTPRSALVSRGKEIAGSEVGDLEKVAKLQQTATPRLQTASSRISVATSFSAISCRSTVLSLELEIERERRQAAEKELEELRKKLAESQRQSAASSQPSNSETSKPTKRSSLVGLLLGLFISPYFPCFNGRPGRCFIDMVSIDQSDPEKIEEGIYGIGGFLSA